MATLIEKKLAKLQPGSKVELTYGNGSSHYEVVQGTVTDNDFCENVEITTPKGEELILAYAIVKLVKSIESFDDGGQPVPPPPPPPVVELHKQTPENPLKINDSELKDAYAKLPREEYLKLSSPFESFKFGIKNNDRERQRAAANTARRILFDEDEKYYDWSADASRFCGSLLARVGLYDPEVFTITNSFHEAAYAAWHEKKYALAGAYAILAMVKDNGTGNRDMQIILATAVVKGKDVSGLRMLKQILNTEQDPNLKAIVAEALAARGQKTAATQDLSAALKLLESMGTGQEMAEEVTYWLPSITTVPETVVKKVTEPAKKPEVQKPIPPPKPVQFYGKITYWNWADTRGRITAEDGTDYPFAIDKVTDQPLKEKIRSYMRSDLGGNTYLVKFSVVNKAAVDIQTDTSLVERARTISADTSRADRFTTAYAMCKSALDTSDARRALGDMVKYAIAMYTNKQGLDHIADVVSAYEKHSSSYPNSAFAIMDLAQCYAYLKKYPQMLELAEKAVVFSDLYVKQRLAMVSQYLKLLRDYYETSGDKSLLRRMLGTIEDFKANYARELDTDPALQKLMVNTTVAYKVIAESGLDMLDAAEADFLFIGSTNPQKGYAEELLLKARARLAPKPDPDDDPTPSPDHPGGAADDPEDEDFEDDMEEEPDEIEIIPYTDNDGWEALELTKEAVVDYALSIGGEGRIGATLAYLRAAASLNSEITPVYHAVALAANDPMEAPDYSITALSGVLASNPDYPDLNACCMGAAFLRASFISGRGYDYSTQGLRDSLSITAKLPALRDAYDTLEEFRKEVGLAIDIYADYRNQGSKQLEQDLAAAVRHADELYTKFVLTPPREGAKFFRLLETKKIVFSKEGYLATMLRRIMDQDLEGLEAEKAHFAAEFLSGHQFSRGQISPTAVDRMVEASWEEAGNLMQMKKHATLQGDRRNNLRSNINEILEAICHWYALSEQSAGLSWKTEAGTAAYLRLRPQLTEQLETLSRDCLGELEHCSDPQLSTGLFLLSATARELSARLDGSWKFGQEKYLYADFLRSENITLNEDFMPELGSTFCALPEFNVLARIRRHVEGEKRTFQQRIDEIYGMEKTRNDYGTAQRILEYLEAMGERDSVTLPDNAEQFVAHTEMQVDMRYRSFRETYALAMSYGQIIKSDPFCNKMEDIVRYWYAFCKETRNYGFFTSILLQSQDKIHASARQYEADLNEQLDTLVSNNRTFFDAHPDYSKAISDLIADQNFTAAEDWLARVLEDGFSLEIQQPEALGYLDHFWKRYANTYARVTDTSQPLNRLLPRREVRNKDTKRAQQLIDNWLSNGNPSNTERIGQLLNLLGWQNIHVSQFQFSPEPRTEIYQVHKEDTSTPLHPIAAFGSSLEKQPMYVICLYGGYDYNRLYEKMRALDAISGNKIILLDYALSLGDRRNLARKLKKRESSLRSINIVIDRVLITHLADNYTEGLINRIVMATTMPFSYCQPYVVESIQTMPPEIFIGRKDELMKIEQPDGVNLIYGGRQLGKSALFKKALADIDGRDGQRAIMVDIVGRDCAAAARKLSIELIETGITPDAEITSDWDELCLTIKRRLRSEEEPITYFLLMLDEADVFISDCASCNYRPLVALKDIQQSLPGKFKYVLAGLHDVVKFNRKVALGSNSVITHMASLKVTPFRPDEAQELLTYPLSYLGISLPSKVTVSQILATANYFPGLIQLYAKKLIESIRAADYAGYDLNKTPPYVVSDEHLRRVMSDKEFVEQIHEKFEITLTLDQDQGSCYYPLTLLIGWLYNVIPSKNGYTAKDIVHHAHDLRVHPLMDLAEDQIDTLLQELQDLNILRNVSSNSYLLASKNFRDLLGSDEEIHEKLTQLGGAAV